MDFFILYLDLIENRRTIRAYSKKELTQEEINTIIYGAMRAPTAGNMMFYSIIQVTDQKLKDRLVVVTYDMQRWWDYFKVRKVEELCQEMAKDFQTPQESDLLLACCDALIAAQNAVIAVEALGIGSCYIGDIMENYEFFIIFQFFTLFFILVGFIFRICF